MDTHLICKKLWDGIMEIIVEWSVQKMVEVRAELMMNVDNGQLACI